MLRQKFGNLWHQVANRAIAEEPEPVAPPGPDALEAVEQAHREWLAARAYFDTVSDPDLVDHAIHLITATERRYMYLLRKAREEGLAFESLAAALQAAGPYTADAPAPPATAVPAGREDSEGG